MWSFGTVIIFVRPRLFPEADTGFRQSQASLIWRELEEEAEGLGEGPRGPFGPTLQRRQAARNGGEEERAEEGPVRRHRRQRTSDYPDDDCIRYFVLGTLAAVLALFVNLVYPLLSKTKWS